MPLLKRTTDFSKYLLGVFFWLPHIVTGQSTGKTDSLLSLYRQAVTGSDKINILLNLASLPEGTRFDEAVAFAEKALQLAKTTNEKELLVECYMKLGNLYHDLGYYTRGLDYYNKAHTCFDSLSLLRPPFKTGRLIQLRYSEILNSMGSVYYDLAYYNRSLHHYLEALKIRERFNADDDAAASLNNVGLVYLALNNLPKALEYFSTALKINRKTGHQLWEANNLTNISLVYSNTGETDKAMDIQISALKIFEKINDKDGINASLNNIATLYSEMQNYDRALEYNFRALKIREEMGDIEGMASSYINIADDYYKKGNYDLSVDYFLKGLEIFSEQDIRDGIIEALKGLSEVFEKTGDYKKSLEFQRAYEKLKDSIYNENNSRIITEMQTLYETEKKEKQIEIQQLEIITKNAEMKKQNIQRMTLAVGFIMVLLLAIIIFMNYRRKKKDNLLLARQKDAIEIQKKIIEDKNLHITESIEYASYIQRSVLPPEETFGKLFPDSFIVYRPKDIVSGDFYYSEKVNGWIILAVADCTGHGVPGALMSMIGNSLLNDIIRDGSITNPALILNELNVRLKKTLNPKGIETRVKDGMDIALLAMQEKTGMILAGGANRPIWYFSGEQFEELNFVKAGIGEINNEAFQFTCSEIKSVSGTVIYLFSDGYETQFGGPKGKKFKSSRLKELVKSIAAEPLPRQKFIIENNLNNWMGIGEQTDDITVIGIRV